VDADIDKAQKKLEELKRQREEIIKSFEKRITPDGVYGDDGKKLDKEIIEKKVAEGKNKLEALTEKGKKLTKGTLTPKDEKEIQDLKDSLDS
jgi:hypothetical protein